MKRPVTLLIILFLCIIAVGHLVRYVYQVPVTVGTIQMPMWISLPAFIVLPVLSILLWKEAKGKP